MAEPRNARIVVPRWRIAVARIYITLCWLCDLTLPGVVDFDHEVEAISCWVAKGAKLRG